ncbi:hypothetical protein FRB97_005380 [Tulasnella sp. 331]|nr:hypothetical protein FRB97_005380 [Tulasnella sp. 331]
MDIIPVELLEEILAVSLHVHPCPSHILCVQSSWRAISQPILHSHIVMRSFSQICRIEQSLKDRIKTRPQIAPKSLLFSKEISTTTPTLLKRISNLLLDLDTRNLKTLRLAVNSHVHTATWAYDGFKCVNPQIFEWCSPDPDHQLSVAIVPRIALMMSSSISTWSNLVSLKLTNVNCTGCNPFLHLHHTTHPNLRYICLGQSVWVTPSAALFPAITLPLLEKLTLVDVYLASIWQRRLRLSDLKEVWENISDHSTELSFWGVSKPDWDTLKTRIECKVERQRLEGGDHGEDMDNAL